LRDRNNVYQRKVELPGGLWYNAKPKVAMGNLYHDIIAKYSNNG